jgi:hypothetical protein
MSEPVVPYTPAEYAEREQRALEAEKRHLLTFADMREKLMAGLGRGELTVTFTLPAMTWLDILDEIEQRRPRNYSMLLRDDLFDQLNAAIDRVHDEANFMIAYGPAGSVASRMDPERAPSRRDLASPELRRILREKDQQ